MMNQNIIKMCALLLIIYLLNGCSKKVEITDKVPITTHSKEALKNFIKGRELSENLQGQESLQYFQIAIEMDPNFAMARYYFALAQPSAKEFFCELKKAVALVDKVSEGERLWILGSEAGINALPLKQRDLFKQLCKAYPADERAQGLLGNHYFLFQMYQEAINQYNKAIKINPQYSQMYNQLGYCYRQLDQYDKAEIALKKYIELIPNDPNPYDSYAELLMKKGEFESSISSYKEALDLNPNFVPSHIGIASNLNFMEKFNEARKQLQKLLEIARNTGEERQAHFAIAVSYLHEGNINAVLQELKRNYTIAEGIKDTAAMALDLMNIGNVFFESGKYNTALEKYNEAWSIVEQSDLDQNIKENVERQTLYNRGRIDLMKGDYAECEQKCRDLMEDAKIVSNTFQIWLAHQLAGRIALHKKDYKRAIQEFEQTNKQDPYNLFLLANAYAGNGEQTKALTYYKKTAFHNTVNSMNYAFVKSKALNMLKSK
jgi:tetratricopeptide (TPR) repeat protein